MRLTGMQTISRENNPLEGRTPDLGGTTNRQSLRKKLMLFRARFLRVVAYLKSKWLAIVNVLSRSGITTAGGPVVSLTSYGHRVRTVHIAIESIARGKVRPSRIILWLDEADVLKDPPAPLRRLMKRGLEIRACQNYGPHKKYFPYVQSETCFNSPLVTADDDIMYPNFWLSQLVEAYSAYPRVVSCFRARVVSFGEEHIAKYCTWELCTSQEPDIRHMAIGTSGVLYPPDLLPILKMAGCSFTSVCPNADDIWLHLQELRAGFPVRQIQPTPLHFLIVPGSEAGALWKSNLGSENDRQIRATYTASDFALLRAQ